MTNGDQWGFNLLEITEFDPCMHAHAVMEIILSDGYTCMYGLLVQGTGLIPTPQPVTKFSPGTYPHTKQPAYSSQLLLDPPPPPLPPIQHIYKYINASYSGSLQLCRPPILPTPSSLPPPQVTSSPLKSYALDPTGTANFCRFYLVSS